MSRGPGRIERAIRQLFDSSPDLAFVTIELVEHCFPELGEEDIERKHEISVLRAARKIVAADPDWQIRQGLGQGRVSIFYNMASVQSFALSRLIEDAGSMWDSYSAPYRSRRRAVRIAASHRHGSPTRRQLVNRNVVPDDLWWRVWRPDVVTDRGGRSWLIQNQDIEWQQASRDELLSALAPGGQYHHVIQPGGHWHRFVQMHIAERDGDAVRLAALQAEREADLAVSGAALAAAYRNLNVSVPITVIDNGTLIKSLADRVRAAATLNDADALRAELAAIADALDAAAPRPPEAG